MTTSQTRPALPTLQHDQRVLLEPTADSELDHGLRDGFPNRRVTIEWYQAAIVRTLGHITERWEPVALLRDRTLLTALVVGPERETFADDPITLNVAREYRQRLERVLVLPAFNLAYNALRKSAGEYPDDVRNEEHDPKGQDFVAMRPAFQVADRQQRAALQRLWGGFDSVEELQSWLHDLSEPTNGALEESLPARVGRDRVAREHFLGRVEADSARDATQLARKYRERFAVAKLLPAFADGIKRLEAGELATHTSDGLTPGQG
ncbi:hypothetical protein [Halorubrum sp. GN12_10-3_MGM]|uniref:hypothetical protein n=1 Tax=Halorubrum sp. GN12_10-3_MGM TaxID=2518113 RepID=UPI0010F846E7|nr:hypothetical protein [Halorubrum sp. GN12_10-3_MGM]TKX64197.1 hypothetical protein EXE47_12515 [Halorubrum sp. GN12_10-3_MGM]